ncbi:Hypothetical protein NTJ_06131 [Nesidiocoris tenuis]|nr:Hypothetical protein NTJ_06131 [Nesidiocoris tenuis]
MGCSFQLNVNETILRQLYKIKNPRSRLVKSGSAGFKATRLIQKQMETLKRVEEIKKERARKKKEKEEAEAAQRAEAALEASDSS